MHMEQNVTLHTLRNAHGLRAEITNLGGRVVSLFVPDKDGKLRDVVLGFENFPKTIAPISGRPSEGTPTD